MATASELNNQIRKKYDNDAKKQALLIEYPTVYIINNTSVKNKDYNVATDSLYFIK